VHRCNAISAPQPTPPQPDPLRCEHGKLRGKCAALACHEQPYPRDARIAELERELAATRVKHAEAVIGRDRLAAEVEHYREEANRRTRETEMACKVQMRLRRALEGVTDPDPCEYDHNQFCQAHYSAYPCVQQIAREALKEKDDGQG
jgi:hypothetical protein